VEKGEIRKGASREGRGSSPLLFKLSSLNGTALECTLESQALLGVVVSSTPTCVHVQELYTLLVFLLCLYWQLSEFPL